MGIDGCDFIKREGCKGECRSFSWYLDSLDGVIVQRSKMSIRMNSFAELVEFYSGRCSKEKIEFTLKFCVVCENDITVMVLASNRCQLEERACGIGSFLTGMENAMEVHYFRRKNSLQFSE